MKAFFAFALGFFALLLVLQQTQFPKDPCDPQQIHIALSDAFTSTPLTPSTMKIIFHTKEECNSAHIALRTPQGDVRKITATAVNFFTENNDGLYTTFVHTFDLNSLEFSQTYQYICYGSDDFFTKSQGPFKFYVPSPKFEEGGKETQVVIFGDMDHRSQGLNTINALTKIAQENFTEVSAFIHNGDMGYNLSSEAGTTGDDFMNAIQKFTKSVPYMVTAGNHEDFNNFSNFNARYKMPNFEQSQNHYYSFNIGNMHFVSFNLELILHEPQLGKYMLDWLEKDLTEAVLNRDKQPWIIAYTHRPFYCSHPNEDCDTNAGRFKEFEDVLNKYSIDLVVVSHVHFYERMLPIKKGQVAKFQQFQEDKKFINIVNPQAPVHVLQGMAGHRADMADPKDICPGKAFTVKVDKAYSYLSVKSSNNTHLLVENFKSVDGAVNDFFYIIKSNESKFINLPFYKGK